METQKTETLLWLILDRSGSMQGKEADVIGGVNKFIAEQKALPDAAVLGMTRFDTEYEEFRPAAPLQKVTSIDAAEYVPRGSTALLDAVGHALGSLEDAWKTYQPKRAIVVIITDGAENASVEFRREQIKSMIEAREKSGKWAFLYFGAGLESFAEAGAMGFSFKNTSGYVPTKTGTQTAYASMASNVSRMRTSGLNVAPSMGGMLDENDPNVVNPALVPNLAQQSKSQARRQSVQQQAWTEPGKDWEPPAA